MISTTRRFFLCSAALCAFVCNFAFAADLPKVSLKTNKGEIVLELYPDVAPKTVENFLRYVKAGHYNGTIFHRIIDGFMIQGGGYDKKLREKPTKKPIPLEAVQALQKGLKNERGVIAMARSMELNSATSQFFINVADNDFLDHMDLPDGDPVTYMRRNKEYTKPRSEALAITSGYAPFGRVIQGMEVVDEIKAISTHAINEEFQNMPNTAVWIVSAKLVK